MEKRRKTKTEAMMINGEIELPQLIIQRIQSFLAGKQAAQTTIVSKSWYKSWLTRPNLDFDQRDFQAHYCCCIPKPRVTDNGFSEFAKKTVKRYGKSKLNIESFKLCINNSDSKSLADVLISESMNLGATDVEFVDKHHRSYVLPHEVFESENLVSLSVEGCKIGLENDVNVSFSRLKSLSLYRVDMDGDIIWDIISSCPSIEKLSLSECMSIFTVETPGAYTSKTTTMFPSSLFIGFGKQNVIDGLSTPYKFHKLECLVLERVQIDDLFLGDLSSKFPCLRDLSVHNCTGYKDVEISSRSLECISFTQYEVLIAKFDVPRIRKFRFLGSIFPVLSVKNALREWESEISIFCLQPGTSQFITFRNFVAELSIPEISLSLSFGRFLELSYRYFRYVKDLPKPISEKLNVSILPEGSVCSAHLDALVWSCRPKVITMYWLPKSSSGIAKKELLDLVCKALVREVSENCYIPNRNTSGLCDLKEVNVGIFEESAKEWRALPWKTLLDASASPQKEREIRFQLEWE